MKARTLGHCCELTMCFTARQTATHYSLTYSILSPIDHTTNDNRALVFEAAKESGTFLHSNAGSPDYSMRMYR